MIEFRGRFSQAEITEVYSEVDIVINPRRKSFLTNSVTPLKPLEAMGYQKLIMASDIGGMREIIKNNKTGLLFKSDSVEEIQGVVLNQGKYAIVFMQRRNQLIDARAELELTDYYKNFPASYKKDIQDR